MNCSEVSLLTLPGISDARGRLTFFSLSEGSGSFDVGSVNIVTGDFNAPIVLGTANRLGRELVIALHGSAIVKVTTLHGEQLVYNLRSPDAGVYLPPMSWRTLTDISDDAVLMFLNSEDEPD